MTQKRVLIIEDSYETQQLLAELVLEPNNYRPIPALDGEEGLRLAQEENPDLIVLDMQLPKLNGLEVLEALNEKGLDIPVIFTTVRESVELVIQAFRLGARDYVIKPFGPIEMQEAIRRVFATGTLREERDQLTQKLVEVNQKLQRQIQEMSVIYTVGRSVTSLLDLNRILNRVVEAAVYLADAEEGLLMLLDKEGDELYLRAAKGLDEKVVRNLRVRVEDSVAGRVISSGRPVFLTGGQAKIVTGYLSKALLYVPMFTSDRGVIGVLGVLNREKERKFTEREMFMISALADYATIAIENARLFEAVEVERTKLATILQEVEGPVIVVDEADRILLCNSAARTLLALSDAEEDLVGLPIDQAVLHPDILGMFQEIQQTNRVIYNEIPLPNRRTFNAQLTPIEGIGRALMMQDVTHLKELTRIKSEFVTAVSHDIRTPLTTIQGYIELLPRAGSLNAQQQEFILMARQSMDTITELIDTLLDVDRLEAGYELEMAACNMVDIIQNAIREIHPLAEDKGQELCWEPPASAVLVYANPHRLRQVIDNLLSNAIKYTPRGGWISVSVEQEEGHIVTQVADNGIGIPPAEQPYIFDKFYRVESKETLSIVGTGLGLSIVKTIIDKHGGRIWVESRPGVGSVFSFLLPVLKESDQ